MKMTVSKPTAPKPVPAAVIAPAATNAFRPVQPEALAAKRRKTYPYLF
jgi:hypothetical protein